jgi:hypothetical protein
MTALHETLAAYLQRRLIDSATGRSEDIVIDNRPKNVLFAGCLTARQNAATDNLESAEDFYARLAPSAIQLRFLVPATKTLVISVLPGCHTYYRVAPPFWAQQRRTAKAEDGVLNTEALVRAFRKCSIQFPVNQVTLVTGRASHVIDLGETINSTVAKAVANDAEALRPRDNWTVPAASLVSEETLRTWCRASGEQVRPPEFAVQVQAELRPWTNPDLAQVIVTLVNKSVPNERFDRADYWESTIFDASLRVTAETDGVTVQPYAFTALPNSYRFDRKQWGAGINCVARVEANRREVVAEAVATYVQPRLEHRSLEGVDLTFNALARDPIPVLRRLRQQMAAYREGAWESKAAELSSYPPDHVFRTEFAHDLADFDREQTELVQGIDILAEPRYSLLRDAFCLANETFAATARSDRWHLFQLVFLVRNLSVLAAREWEDVAATDDVEVLWFPTGGGKTEAFLGLLTTALFFDRLRGRANGVTGVVRLPLRLLSHQQFQRIVRIVSAAEAVRRRKHVGGRPFSVGYWIGQGGSPNTVDEVLANEWEANPASCQRLKKIQRCPYCGGGLTLRFNRALWSLAHHCANLECGTKGDLPIYIVDDELYRFLPSVVVGTVDKLAAFGFQRRFSNLMGWPTSVCPKHGFSSGTACALAWCKEETKDVVLKDPVPSLLIQDELHLLKEDLGAFDGHYETAVMGAQAEVPGGRPWKIIAATATIEQYDWQAYHLYCKAARRFPSPGPSWQDTFYSSTTADTNRLFLGILPFNRSHINAMISTLWIYHREIRALRKRVAEGAQAVARSIGYSGPVDESALIALLNDYEVSLTYVLTRKAGDQMAESMATQVAGYLRDENEEPVSIRSLTGGSSTIEVEQILDEIYADGRRTTNSGASVDAVVATSMISHGVDVDRFNFIAFFGMPRMTAEYIQASSRVGRKFPGLALIVFSPARERDRSHFHLFGKYHQYLERLVEPPAINRWAEFAIRHTLPGIFVGSVINVVSRQLKRNLYLERDLYTALHIDRSVNLEDLTDRVVRYYGADAEQALVVRAEVGHRLELFLNGLRRNAARTIWSAPDFKPMMSLRDVEEPVFFMASQYSAKAFELWIKRRRLTAASGEIAIE